MMRTSTVVYDISIPCTTTTVVVVQPTLMQAIITAISPLLYNPFGRSRM
jgi:hypothetical protein